LEQREVLTRDVFVRSAAPLETPVPVGFRELSVLELLAAIRRVLERLPKDVVHEVTLDKITVRQKMALLLDTLRAQPQVLFEALFTDVKTRLGVVVTFLAMLELVKVRAIRIFQEEQGGPIVIEAAVDMEAAAATATMEEPEEEHHGA
jgi:segregation and condensation protein A